MKNEFVDDRQRVIKDKAVAYARKNKKVIARRLADKTKYEQDPNPVSVFMAGSPGAGKTEASISLLERFQSNKKILRIDPDELRVEFEEYTGNNSWLFQGPVSILVDAIHDLALNQKQNFLLDGTLSNYEKARENISRSLKRNREVQLLYVYQRPDLAWRFVLEREKLEGRNIRPEVFLDQYFAAWKNVNKLKEIFGSDIHVDLLLKDIEGSRRLFRAGIDRIDHHIEQIYSENDIRKMIGII